MPISKSDSLVNFKFSSPFKFKLLQSCQVNFNLFLRYNLLLLSVKWLVHIQEQLVPVNLSLLSVKWLVRIQEQLVPVNLFPSLSSVEPLVRIQEQLVLVLCFLQPSDQFKYKNSLCFLLFFQPSNQLKYESSLRPFTCQYSRSSSQFEPKEQLVPVNLLLSLPSESCYSVNVYQSRNGYDILRFCYSVNVYKSRNGYDIFC